jgi:hypothetical protein
MVGINLDKLTQLLYSLCVDAQGVVDTHGLATNEINVRRDQRKLGPMSGHEGIYLVLLTDAGLDDLVDVGDFFLEVFLQVVKASRSPYVS